MPLTGHHQKVEIRLWQIEEPLFLELAHEPGRTRPVIPIPSLMAALRIVQQGEQVRHPRGNAELACESAAMECHPRPMARTMDTIPVETKRLPYPANKTGGQARWCVVGQARRTACAL
jgi:hypothetical protein